MRAAPEQVMICDIHDMIADGDDLNRTDDQGATLVSRIATLSTLSCPFGPTGVEVACGAWPFKISKASAV